MSCCPSHSVSGHTQRGAALLIAVFVLALVGSMLVGLSTSAVVAARRAENQLLADQAWYYLLGAEELAIELLQLKRREDALKAQLGRAEKPVLAPVELFGRYDTDHGWLAFEVSDLQGRFNLNSLRQADASVVMPDVPHNLEQQRFVRLLQSLDGLEVAPELAVQITEALLDWMDSDELETGFGGAELPHYAKLPLPYRPADSALRGVSELLQVKGVSAELYQALAPHVTVWAPSGAGINVASASVPVLRALYEEQGLQPLSAEDGEALLKAREAGEIADLSEFLARPEWGSTTVALSGLVDSSDLYMITSHTRVGRIDQVMDSVVQLSNDDSRVLARSLRML